MGDLERTAVAGTLRADVYLPPSAYGYVHPTIQVALVGAEDGRGASAEARRWLASAVYLLAAAVELESIGFGWAVTADARSGRVELGLASFDEETVEAAMQALRAVVAATPLEGVRCA
jgi:hypothetical protein